MIIPTLNDNTYNTFVLIALDFVKMTKFEFASVHFDGEETIKEIWDLKYEHENSEDEPQPLFAFTASSLFPTFMWKTLIRRFEDHINSTKNGIKGRPLLN